MKFRPGEAGNPAGRPVGSGIVGECRKKLQAKLPEVVEMLIQKTLEGDVISLKLYLERVMPALKPEHLPVTIDAPEQAKLPELGNIVIRAIASGDLSPDQGAQLISALAGQAKLIEVTELERRIEQLEQSQSKQDQ